MQPAAPRRPPPEVKVTATGQRITTHHAPAPAPRRGAAAASAGHRFPKGTTTARARAPAAAAAAAAPRDAAVPGVSQTCRRCGTTQPLSNFFVDRRLETGVTHLCATCAKHNGLSGRPPTAAELQAIRAAAAARGAGPAARAPQRGSFFGGAAAPPAVAPAVAAVRSGAAGKRTRAAAALDRYEADFVDSEDEGGDDWRAALHDVRSHFCDWRAALHSVCSHCLTGVRLSTACGFSQRALSLLPVSIAAPLLHPSRTVLRA